MHTHMHTRTRTHTCTHAHTHTHTHTEKHYCEGASTEQALPGLKWCLHSWSGTRGFPGTYCPLNWADEGALVWPSPQQYHVIVITLSPSSLPVEWQNVQQRWEIQGSAVPPNIEGEASQVATPWNCVRRKLCLILSSRSVAANPKWSLLVGMTVCLSVTRLCGDLRLSLHSQMNVRSPPVTSSMLPSLRTHLRKRRRM